jgi:adenylate cyclase
MKPGRFFAELKRRNVIRAAILYLGAVWALAQGIAQLGPSVGAPDWTTRWFLVAAAIGFPFWIAFAWFYEFTPEGLKRESEIEASSITRHTGRKLDFTIIGVLTVAVVLLLTDRFVLRRVDETTVAPITENSIAVLPFVNMSEDRANEYFSDGISEELLNLLTKVPQLQVAARTSSFSFKGRQVEIPEIGRQLHVANVLEGSVRKSGDRVRITAQLIRAGGGFHLWSETYDRKLDDIFKIQDEIAAEVVKQLKVRLLGAAPTVRQTDPKGYMLYLQAVQLGRQNTPEAFTQSDGLYRQVLEIDPRYAPAWRELSRNFTNEADAGLLSNSEGYARAREAGEKALAIDPNYASAHSGLGWIAMANHDFVNAAKHFERALALDSNDLSVPRGGAGDPASSRAARSLAGCSPGVGCPFCAKSGWLPSSSRISSSKSPCRHEREPRHRSSLLPNSPRKRGAGEWEWGQKELAATLRERSEKGRSGPALVAGYDGLASLAGGTLAMRSAANVSQQLRRVGTERGNLPKSLVSFLERVGGRDQRLSTFAH